MIVCSLFSDEKVHIGDSALMIIIYIYIYIVNADPGCLIKNQTWIII